LRTQPLFKCPNCTTRYHVVQGEADPSTNVEINCLVCDQPLLSRDGRFILKYFLLDGPRRRAGSSAKNGTVIRTPTNTLS
jgi:hypothetical protein